MADKKMRFKFNSQRDATEVLCFEDELSGRYLYWKIPENIVDELVDLLKSSGKAMLQNLPFKRAGKNCEFSMITKENINIRKIDEDGNYRMTGWCLPFAAAEELCLQKNKNK